MSNIETAKAIETARNASFGINLRGTVYFVVNSVNEINHNIDTTITNAKYQAFKGAYVPKDTKLIAASDA